MNEPLAPESDQLHKELLLAAMQLPEAQRGEFVQRAAGGVPGLAGRVLGLLAALQRAEQAEFLAERSAGLPEVDASATDENLGSSIGPYRLVATLGEGGFGRVYLARQEQPLRRDVAVKVLKPGTGGPQVLARFDAERQVLARMDHPGIARILDAATTGTGQPYFVMEHVDGAPLTHYCDRGGLDLRARLELFVQVCFAVHHAHQKGVLHRDLKPSNVLVTEVDGAPRPKIIDFGIAKALDAADVGGGEITGVRQILGSPRYMSPEQARVGLADVDTRSDIYSLGVVLHELLTGVTPHGARLEQVGVAGIQRILQEELPKRPSALVRDGGDAFLAHAERMQLDPPSLVRALRDDLDWIVLKALEKDPSRRYDAAAALARDVQRHLDHLPVSARRPAASYLVWKFVQRNQVAATAIIAVGVALVVGLVLATMGLDEASRQRDLAREQLRELHKAQARAARVGGAPGRRAAGLESVRQAAAIRSAPDLRDEAIACLAVADLTPVGELRAAQWPGHFGARSHDLVVGIVPDGVAVLDARTGDVVRVLDGAAVPYHVAFSRDGSHVALLAEGGRLDVAETATGRRVFALDAGRAAASGFAFDAAVGRPRWFAAAGSDGMVHVHDLAADRELAAFAAPPGRLSLAGAPGGERIAIATEDGARAVEIRDVRTGELRVALATGSGVHALDWSHDGRLVAAACVDAVVQLWNAEQGVRVGTLRGHQADVVRVAFDPSGQLIATGSWDSTVRLWRVPTAEPVLGPLLGQRLVGLSSRLLTESDGKLTVWSLEDDGVLRLARAAEIFGGDFVRVAVHERQRWFATSGRNGLWIWGVDPLVAARRLFEQPVQGVHLGGDGRQLIAVVAGDVLSLPVGDDGPVPGAELRRLASFRDLRSTSLDARRSQLLVASEDRLCFLDLDTGSVVRTLPGYRGLATPASRSPDGRWLFTGTWKGEPAAVWDLSDDRMVARFEGGHVAGAFDPDGRVLCVARRAEQQLLEVGSWRPLHTIPRLRADEIAGPVAFDPAGRFVAVSADRFTTRLVDVGSGRVLGTLPNADGFATGDVCFGAGGRLLVAISSERAVACWDLLQLRSRLAALGLDW